MIKNSQEDKMTPVGQQVYDLIDELIYDGRLYGDRRIHEIRRWIDECRQLKGDGVDAPDDDDVDSEDHCEDCDADDDNDENDDDDDNNE
jgi:hypothetical protein